MAQHSPFDTKWVALAGDHLVAALLIVYEQRQIQIAYGTIAAEPAPHVDVYAIATVLANKPGAVFDVCRIAVNTKAVYNSLVLQVIADQLNTIFQTAYVWITEYLIFFDEVNTALNQLFGHF